MNSKLFRFSKLTGRSLLVILLVVKTHRMVQTKKVKFVFLDTLTSTDDELINPVQQDAHQNSNFYNNVKWVLICFYKHKFRKRTPAFLKYSATKCDVWSCWSEYSPKDQVYYRFFIFSYVDLWRWNKLYFLLIVKD